MIGQDWKCYETLRHFELSSAYYVSQPVLNLIVDNLAKAKNLKVLKLKSLYASLGHNAVKKEEKKSMISKISSYFTSTTKKEPKAPESLPDSDWPLRLASLRNL